MELATFQLNDCHGYSVKFSPFVPNRLACAASHNYGLSGIYHSYCAKLSIQIYLYVTHFRPRFHIRLRVDSGQQSDFMFPNAMERWSV